MRNTGLLTIFDWENEWIFQEVIPKIWLIDIREGTLAPGLLLFCTDCHVGCSWWKTPWLSEVIPISYFRWVLLLMTHMTRPPVQNSYWKRCIMGRPHYRLVIVASLWYTLYTLLTLKYELKTSSPITSITFARLHSMTTRNGTFVSE